MAANASSPLTQSELQIVAEIARHQVDPNPVQRVLKTLGMPMEKALEFAGKIPVLKKLPELVHQGVAKALRASVTAGGLTFSNQGILNEYRTLHGMGTPALIAQATLQERDQVADRFRLSNALLVGTEGALFGAGASICEWLPGAQLLLPAIIAADIAASMTILSRHASQIAASYGYSPKDPRNLPHVLASMVSYQDFDEEDGFFAAKAGVAAEVRAASLFAARSAGLSAEELLRQGQAPILVRLITRIATRLEISITEKELAMLLPLAGAGLNGAVNVAFQQAGHFSGKDYFRRVSLAEKYGADVVKTAILNAVDDYHRSKS